MKTLFLPNIACGSTSFPSSVLVVVEVVEDNMGNEVIPPLWPEDSIAILQELESCKKVIETPGQSALRAGGWGSKRFTILALPSYENTVSAKHRLRLYIISFFGISRS